MKLIIGEESATLSPNFHVVGQYLNDIYDTRRFVNDIRKFLAQKTVSPCVTEIRYLKETHDGSIRPVVSITVFDSKDYARLEEGLNEFVTDANQRYSLPVIRRKSVIAETENNPEQIISRLKRRKALNEFAGKYNSRRLRAEYDMARSSHRRPSCAVIGSAVYLEYEASLNANLNVIADAAIARIKGVTVCVEPVNSQIDNLIHRAIEYMGCPEQQTHDMALEAVRRMYAPGTDGPLIRRNLNKPVPA